MATISKFDIESDRNMKKNLVKKLAKITCLITLLIFMSACTLFQPTSPGIGKAIEWDKVKGWQDDRHEEAWPALINNCLALSKKRSWQEICEAIPETETITNETAKQFFETWFTPHLLHGEGGKSKGLITGYYEPLLFGSKTKSSRYQFPIYEEPDSLLTIELGNLYPDLKGKRVRGLLNGKKVIPFYSREEIESNRKLLAGHELLWLDDRDDVFFLQIQGSGRVQLDNGKIVAAGYSNQNGHPYVAIGKILLERGELESDEISLFTIRQWLIDNPHQAENLLNENPSYVFFILREDPDKGPIGSLNVPLTPERSIAIDPKLVDLGTPIWLETNLPGKPDQNYKRLVIAQDTGGAIRGPLRADLFWGMGNDAEQSAGIMKEQGSMIVLLPNSKQRTSTQ